jgi:hypothetical protein
VLFVTRRTTALLGAILLVALALRVWGLGFGLPFANARPDETAVAGPAVDMLTGDLRPPSFNKPTLFVYAASAAYAAYFVVTSPFADYGTLQQFAESRRENIAPFLYITRALSAVMGVLAVWWLYGLARRTTGDEVVALVAAALLAVAFLPVRDSHFGVTDMPMVALVVLAVRQIVAWQQDGGWRRALVAGAIGGAAMSVKYNGLGVAVPFAVACLMKFDGRHPAREVLQQSMRDGGIFAIVLVAALLAGSPFVLIDWTRFIQDVTRQEMAVTAGHGLVLARGWWQHATVTLPAALGWPLYLSGVAGATAFLVADFRKAVVVLSFPIAYYVVAGHGYTVFARYILPVIPFLCFSAAWGIVHLARTVSPSHTTRVLVATTALVASPTVVQSIWADYLLTQTDNRVLAADALDTLMRPEESFYLSGSAYGHPQIASRFGHQTDTFTSLPDWIVLQRSPLLVYADLPESLLQTVSAHYERVETLPVGDDRNRLYDQQDAFFLPLATFAGLDRPGPAFELYRKR